MERKLNILFLPENIASIPALTASSLDKKSNIVARCLSRIEHKYQQQNETLVFLPKIHPKNNPLKWLYSKWQYRKQLKKWVYWADILHYTFTTGISNGADLKWARKQNKTIIIEWVGSDIRNPDILKKINPFYKYAFNNGYEYAHVESKKNSLKNQLLFAKYKAIPFLFPEMKLFVEQSLFNKTYLVFQRINLEEFIPHFPDINNRKPLIVHSPSAKIAKGTNILLPVIESLKKEFDFDFVLLHNLSRQEVLKTIRNADIFIDQLILGNYGMASIEAMSFGKPVMCYLMPEIFAAGLPDECPIINTNAINLKEQLIQLIANSKLRYEAGIKSRKFVEKFHDVELISNQLLSIYKAEWEKNNA